MASKKQNTSSVGEQNDGRNKHSTAQHSTAQHSTSVILQQAQQKVLVQSWKPRWLEERAPHVYKKPEAQASRSG